jgi:O-antigen/teichoic acid export membrane protein
MKKYGKLIVVNSIAYIAPLITMVALSLIYKLSLNSVLYILSAFFTISFILGGLLIKSSITIKNVKKRILLNTWKFSKWLVGKAIVQWLSGNYFIVIAGLILGKNTIGVIRIVQNLFGVLNVLLMAIENYLAIKSSAIYSHDGIKALVKFQYHVLFRISFFILFILGVVSLFSQSIIMTLYGVEYTEYYYLVYWFSILYVIIFLNLPNRFVLRTLLKTNVIFYSYVASTIFSLLFARPLINTYGIIGVAIGLIACQLIMFCWNHIMVFKYLNK